MLEILHPITQVWFLLFGNLQTCQPPKLSQEIKIECIRSKITNFPPIVSITQMYYLLVTLKSMKDLPLVDLRKALIL